MSRHAHYIPQGVIPAVLLPFNEDLSIDERSFRSHLRDVAGTNGLSAITVNAHSTEVASCSFEEQQRVLGVIGRRYHAEFRPVLRKALRNSNGFIRAQAAAVASGLDADEKTRLWREEDGRKRPDWSSSQDSAAPDALDVERRRP